MSATVLVTGVGQHLGARYAREAAATSEIDRVIGVDTATPPQSLGGAEFVRADLRNPVIGRIVEQAGVDTVVHLGVSDACSGHGGARASQKEHNVIGTMHLLAACQAQRRLRRIVLKSSDAVYGSSARAPVRFVESTPTAGAHPGWVRDVIEVEALVQGVSRRRPDVSTCVLRLAHLVGPHVTSAMTEYLRPRFVPAPLGFDARLQLLHEDDAVAALRAATTAATCGVVNVAGEGVVPLSRAIRLTHGVVVPVYLAGGIAGAMARRVSPAPLPRDEIDYLTWGRVLDTTRLRDEVAFTPAWSTRAALVDFAASLGDTASGPPRAGARGHHERRAR